MILQYFALNQDGKPVACERTFIRILERANDYVCSSQTESVFVFVEFDNGRIENVCKRVGICSDGIACVMFEF